LHVFFIEHGTATRQIVASKNNRSLTIGAAINGGGPQAKGVVTIKRFNDTDLN
jgi:hypothetical protein